MGGSDPKFYRGALGTKQEVAGHKVGVAGIFWHNDHNAKMFLQIFNKATAAVTVGTTTPDISIGLAADTSDTFNFFNATFDTGFTFAITTATGGATAGGVHDVVIFVV